LQGFRCVQVRLAWLPAQLICAALTVTALHFTCALLREAVSTVATRHATREQ